MGSYRREIGDFRKLSCGVKMNLTRPGKWTPVRSCLISMHYERAWWPKLGQVALGKERGGWSVRSLGS